MASYFEKRAKELGLNVPASGQSSSGSYFQQRAQELGLNNPPPTQTPQRSNFFEQRSMELGLTPPQMPDQINVMDVRRSPVSQQSAQFTPPMVNQSLPSPVVQDDRNPVTRTLDYIFKENPISRVLNRPFAAAAQSLIPDAPMIKDGQTIPGTSARQQFAERNPIASTGSESLDKGLDVAGNIGGYFMNPSGQGQNVMRIYDAVAPLAQNISSRVAQRLPDAGMRLSKDGTRVVDSMLSRGVQEGTREALAAATYAVPRSLIQGESDPLEIAKNVAIEGALGAATGAVAPYAGDLLSRATQPIRDRLRPPVDELTPPNYQPYQEAASQSRITQATESADGVQAMIRQGSQQTPTSTNLTRRNVRQIPDDVQAMAMQTSDGRQLLPRGDGSQTSEVVRRSEILADLANELGVPIRTGRYNYDAHGIFKTKSGVVRTKLANDLPTVVHEIGHWMDKEFKLGAPQFDNELLKLGRTTSASGYSQEAVRNEGVAEFFRLLVQDPKQAKELAPGFYDQAMNKLSNKAKKAILKAQSQTEKYINQPILQKSISELSVGKKDPFNLPTPDEMYTKLVDELHPIKRATQKLGESGERLFRDFWLLRGVTGKAQAGLKRSVYDQNFNKIGESLETILSPVKQNLDEFRSYIKDKRAIELDKRDIMTGSDLTIPERKANIDDLERRYPSFVQAHEELKHFQDHGLNDLIDSGILDPENVARFKEVNKEYVPFFRDYKAEVGAKRKPGGGIRKGIANQDNPIRRIKGGDEEIVDPLESIIKNYYQYTAIAEKNRVLKNFVDEATKMDGLGGLVEKVDTPMQMRQFTLEDLRSTLEKQGVKTDELDMDTVVKLFQPSNVIPGKDNIISIFRDGKREFYQLDPDLYRAVTAMDNDQMGTLMRIANFPTRLLRAGVVNTLEFWLRNMWRDQFEAAIKSKNGYIPWYDMVRGIGHVLRRSETFDQFMAAGGAQSLRTSLDRKYLQGDLRSILSRSMKDKAMNVIKNPLEAMRALSELSEMGTRIGEFSRSMQRNPTPEGIRNAALDARDLIDFSRSGTVGKNVNKISAFWNAQVQGLDKTRRMFMNKKQAPKVLAKSLALITGPTWALYEYNKDDPRYQELAQWDKDLFWHFWVGDTHYRLPIPFELGVMFKVIPERIMSMTSGEEEPFRQFGKTLHDTFYPAVSIQLLEPWIQAYANKNFMGTPIVPRREESLNPEDQAGPYTSTVAKAIARIPGIRDNEFTDEVLGSPRKVDHIINGYFGSLGKYSTQLIDKGLEKSGVINPPPKPKTGLEDSPFFKAIIGRTLSGNTDSVDKFYERLDDLTREKNRAEKRRNPFEEAGELKKLQRVSKRMSEVSKQIREIQADPNMPSEEKTEKIQELNLISTNLARLGLDKKPLELGDFFPSKRK